MSVLRHAAAATGGDPTPEEITRIREVTRAIDGVLVAFHTLHHALRAGHVPFGAFTANGRWEPTPLADGIARYGNSLVFAIWQMGRAVEALRVAWTGKPSAALVPSPDEPDEAPGLDVPKPSDGAFAQERLAATQIGET